MMPPTDAHALEGDRLLRMARTKARLGRVQQAITQYDEALAVRPGFADAFVEVVDLLAAAQDWPGIAQRCETWIAHHPDHASHALSDRVHNLRIDALCRIGGIELAYDAYGLEQVTGGPVALGDDEIVAVVGARNERSRLPFLLEHHRRLGVDRFLLVDNGSDDGSVEYLLGEPDTIVWRTTESFLRSNCGAAWTELVLRRHAPEQWCLVFDADELLVYPGFEHRGLREFCADLDREGATCYRAIQLDMYGDGRLSETTYRAGQDPLEVFPYFDRVHYRLRIPFDGPRRNMTNYWGGVRSRIFGGNLGGYLLNKVPLFRYSPGEVLMSGQHWLDRPTDEIAVGRGALLHFKYTSTFASAVAEEVTRKEHARRACVYDEYARGLEACPDPVLFDPMHSVRYESSEQLVAIGVMRDGSATECGAVTRDSVLISAIPAVPTPATASDRPFWSVVISVRADDDDTRGRVEHVLRALDGTLASEVVIVAGPRASLDAAGFMEPCASRGHGIVVVPTAEHLNDVESANLGLCHTRGSWVHVLGPDAVAPDFYRLMGEAVTDEHTALAVAHGGQLDRGIDLDFAMRPACFVARRHLYERAGGFCATMPFAASWEMFQRLAHTAGVAPVSVPVATQDGDARSTSPSEPFARYGEEVLQWLAAIDLVCDIADLPPSDVAALHDRCARQAADVVRDDLERGRFASALATIGEALRVPINVAAREHLTAALVRTLR
jgi:hypothetical protein